MTAAKPPPERYGIELCLAHRRKAETDGASRIVYEAMAYRYLDAFIVERAAVEKRELALREALEEIQEQRGVLCTSECHASQRMVEIASSALASYRARARSGWREAMKPEDCVRRLRELTDPNTYSGPQSIASTARLASTIIERLAGELKAVTDAGFRIEKNVAHPFLGPTDEDRLTLWCIECGRDSGYHREDCSKSNSR